jgi:hypothetical protein
LKSSGSEIPRSDGIGELKSAGAGTPEFQRRVGAILRTAIGPLLLDTLGTIREELAVLTPSLAPSAQFRGLKPGGAAMLSHFMTSKKQKTEETNLCPPRLRHLALRPYEWNVFGRDGDRERVALRLPYADALVVRGYLSEEEQDNGAAIKKAIECVISDMVFELQSETAERGRARVWSVDRRNASQIGEPSTGYASLLRQRLHSATTRVTGLILPLRPKLFIVLYKEGVGGGLG